MTASPRKAPRYGLGPVRCKASVSCGFDAVAVTSSEFMRTGGQPLVTRHDR